MKGGLEKVEVGVAVVIEVGGARGGTGWHRDKLFNQQGAMATGVDIVSACFFFIFYFGCYTFHLFAPEECRSPDDTVSSQADWLSGFPGGLLAV